MKNYQILRGALGAVLCLFSAFVTAKASQFTDVRLGSWTNGAVWYDTAGHVINAHGGGVLAHDGKYYLYGEHKIYGTHGNRAHAGVHLYSSVDLENWTDEGIVLQVENRPGSDIEDGCILERPKILFCDKTGKFVMFFHLELKGKGCPLLLLGIDQCHYPNSLPL